MLEVGDMIISAAEMRTESRGSHFRSDFPSRDDENWLTNIFISKDDSGLKLKKRWVADQEGWADQPGDVRITPWG